MKVISLIQRKGGSSKTSTAVHLAEALSVLYPHLHIALADADPQRSATIWIQRSKGVIGVSVHPIAGDGEGRNMKAEIEAIGADIVIIDTPPALEGISLRAALRADLMLVPTSPSIIDLAATKDAINTCLEAIKINPAKRYLIVPSRVQHNTAAGHKLRSVLAEWGPVSETSISMRVAFAESAIIGLGVSRYAPESPAAQEIGLLAEEVSCILSIQ